MCIKSHFRNESQSVFEKVLEGRKKTMDLRQIQPTPNLIDAFEVIDVEDFTNLWRFLVRVHTIIPTTVACEQSFSFFKRTIHINMSDQTSKIFLTARLSHYNSDCNL